MNELAMPREQIVQLNAAATGYVNKLTIEVEATAFFGCKRRLPAATARPSIRRTPARSSTPSRLRVEIDRNAGQVRLKALVSSAFGEARNLSDLGDAGDPALSVKAIPLARHKSNPVARIDVGQVSLGR